MLVPADEHRLGEKLIVKRAVYITNHLRKNVEVDRKNQHASGAELMTSYVSNNSCGGLVLAITGEPIVPGI